MKQNREIKPGIFSQGILKIGTKTYIGKRTAFYGAGKIDYPYVEY
jgi:hypothetical protein